MKKERRHFLNLAVGALAVGLSACAEQAGIPKEPTVRKTLTPKPATGVPTIINGLPESADSTDVPEKIVTLEPTIQVEPTNVTSPQTIVETAKPVEEEKGPVPVMVSEQIIFGDRVIRIALIADPSRVSKSDLSHMIDPTSSRTLIDTMQLGATALADVTRAEYILQGGIVSRPDELNNITRSFDLAEDYRMEVIKMNQRGIQEQNAVATPTPNPANSEFGWTRNEFGIAKVDKEDWKIVKDGAFVTDGRFTVNVSIMKSPDADNARTMKEGNPIETYLGQVARIIGAVVTEIDLTDQPLTKLGQDTLNGLSGYLRDVSTIANAINYEETPTPNSNG